MPSLTTSTRPGPRTMAVPVLGAVLAVGLLAGCSAGSGAAARGQASPAGTSTGAGSGIGTAGPAAAAAAAAVQREFVSVIRRVMPSVVEIRTNEGLGSGVVLDSDGDIVTNAHVIADASSFQVLSTQATGSAAVSAAPLPAVLIGSCPGADLAVIKVSADAGLHPATFGDLKSVAVGDLVLAIGSPLGLGGSVTEGIVSAVGRSVAEPANAGAAAAVLANAIQTSAAINPGNSGGALVSIDGAVIGIPTLAAVNRGGAAPGIGFAIPASDAVSVGEQLTSATRANRGTALNGCRR